MRCGKHSSIKLTLGVRLLLTAEVTPAKLSTTLWPRMARLVYEGKIDLAEIDKTRIERTVFCRNLVEPVTYRKSGAAGPRASDDHFKAEHERYCTPYDDWKRKANDPSAFVTQQF